MTAPQVGIGLSGGVDSAIAAHLLTETGYRVTAFFMRLPVDEADSQEQRAGEVAAALGISLQVIAMQDVFQEKIIQPFLDEYRMGRTPNPCVRCNRIIKFGLLADHMLKQGMDMVASGHYARIERTENGKYALRRGRDQSKDQSYFLCRLGQEQLGRILFPLGSLRKKEVKKLAASLGLARKVSTESQDVCFLNKGLRMFLVKHGLAGQPGEICSLDGRVLGTHAGIHHYTVGQRRGLGLPDATPWYVVRLDPIANQVIVGKDEDLFRRGFYVDRLHWLGPEKKLPWRGGVQLRSRHTPAPATLTMEKSRWRITCDEPQRAITPGQYAVLYEGDEVIASAVILNHQFDRIHNHE
jgi:tRNA-specific 2-thiouridylase